MFDKTDKEEQSQKRMIRDGTTTVSRRQEPGLPQVKIRTSQEFALATDNSKQILPSKQTVVSFLQTPLNNRNRPLLLDQKSEQELSINTNIESNKMKIENQTHGKQFQIGGNDKPSNRFARLHNSVDAGKKKITLEKSGSGDEELLK